MVYNKTGARQEDRRVLEVRGKRPVDPEELLARKNSMAIESPGH